MSTHQQTSKVSHKISNFRVFFRRELKQNLVSHARDISDTLKICSKVLKTIHHAPWLHKNHEGMLFSKRYPIFGIVFKMIFSIKLICHKKRFQYNHSLFHEPANQCSRPWLTAPGTWDPSNSSSRAESCRSPGWRSYSLPQTVGSLALPCTPWALTRLRRGACREYTLCDHHILPLWTSDQAADLLPNETCFSKMKDMSDS